jgi:hypothetical protein
MSNYTYIDSNVRRVSKEITITNLEVLMRDITKEIGFLEENKNVFRLYEKGQIKYVEIAFSQPRENVFEIKISYLTNMGETQMSSFFIDLKSLTQKTFNYSKIENLKTLNREFKLLPDLWDEIFSDIRECWKRVSFKENLI